MMGGYSFDDPTFVWWESTEAHPSFSTIVHCSLKEVTMQPIRLSIRTRFMRTGYLANLYFSGRSRTLKWLPERGIVLIKNLIFAADVLIVQLLPGDLANFRWGDSMVKAAVDRSVSPGCAILCRAEQEGVSHHPVGASRSLQWWLNFSSSTASAS
jgi:hypothetical protein